MLRRLLLSALVAVAAVGAARADGPYPAPPQPSPPNPGNQSWVYKMLHPIQSHECWTHPNSDYGCGSLRSDFNFIFGDCRSFWGEPCYKGGPPTNGPCTTGGCYR
jgi:hypothetical protein